MSHSYWEELHKTLLAAGDPDRAMGMRAYMRDLFPFAGVPSPQRKQLLKGFVATHPLPEVLDFRDVVQAGWQYQEREMYYCTMEALWIWRKRLVPGDEALLASLITTNAWWDTVDFLAATIMGYFCGRYKEVERNVPDRWMASGNVWLQRSALLYQQKYKEATDKERLFGYCRELAGHPDFFIRKAIGWSLRQYARTNPEAVQAFVAATNLSPLSRREALKHLQ